MLTIKTRDRIVDAYTASVKTDRTGELLRALAAAKREGASDALLNRIMRDATPAKFAPHEMTDFPEIAAVVTSAPKAKAKAKAAPKVDFEAWEREAYSAPTGPSLHAHAV